MHNINGYIAEFCPAVSRVVGITDAKILDRFVAELMRKIREQVLLS